MNRRNLLRSLGMLPLLYAPLGDAFVRANVARAAPPRPNRRLRPSDRNWPDAASWANLKADLGGQLIEPKALFGSCAAEPNGSACLDAHQNIGNPFWIGDQPAGTQVSGWLDAWTPAPSAYVIKARDAADVAASVNFAR